jgi:hypothetical protein
MMGEELVFLEDLLNVDPSLMDIVSFNIFCLRIFLTKGLDASDSSGNSY